VVCMYIFLLAKDLNYFFLKVESPRLTGCVLLHRRKKNTVHMGEGNRREVID